MSQQTFKQGPRYRFRDQVFWAEGGLICIEDRNTGNFKAITRVEAAARAITFNEELQYMDYPDERDELMHCVVDLCEAVKEAKRQGDPTDPEVRKQLVKDRKKISVLMSPGPSSVEVLGNSNMDYAGLGRATLVSHKQDILMSDKFRKLMI